MRQYEHDHTKRWAETIDELDGYVFLTPEYNHSYSGALKNAIDYIYAEWNDKAAGIVSYGGGAAGVRAAEALRLVLAEMQVATVRAQPAIPLMAAFATGSFAAPETLSPVVSDMLDQVISWSGALRSVRERKAEARAAA